MTPIAALTLLAELKKEAERDPGGQARSAGGQVRPAGGSDGSAVQPSCSRWRWPRCPACVRRPVDNPNIIVMGMTSGPNNLDPRIASDDTSQKLNQLIFSSLMTLDEHLRRRAAARREHREPGSADLGDLGAPRRASFTTATSSPRPTWRIPSAACSSRDSSRALKGAYRMVRSIDVRDRYTVVFNLNEPFVTFPGNLVVPPIAPDGAGPSLRDHPIGTGPYKFVSHAVDDRLELAAFDDYYGGRPRNDGIIFRFVPDDIMRGLELRKGTMDLVINDIAPDIVHQLERQPSLQKVQSPGTDYQYIGLNLRDPILRDLRVRQALAYAIDYQAIIEYLRRGLASPAVGIIPPVAWVFEPNVFSFTHDPGAGETSARRRRAIRIPTATVPPPASRCR